MNQESCIKKIFGSLLRFRRGVRGEVTDFVMYEIHILQEPYSQPHPLSLSVIGEGKFILGILIFLIFFVMIF